MQPLLDPHTKRPIDDPILLTEGDTKIVGVRINGHSPEFLYIEDNPSGVVNCAPVVHLAHSIAQYDSDYDMRSVLLGNKNITEGDIIFYQICALSPGRVTLEVKLDNQSNEQMSPPITLIVNPKPKKNSFGTNISFAHIWNMSPHHHDPIDDQPEFEYQVCKAQLNHPCMVIFCTTLKRAGVSLDGLHGTKCGQRGHEHEHHFTNPYDFRVRLRTPIGELFA